MRERGGGAPGLTSLAHEVDGCAAVRHKAWRRVPTINQGGAREDDSVRTRREFGEIGLAREKRVSRRPSERPSLLPAWTRSGAEREIPSQRVAATWPGPRFAAELGTGLGTSRESGRKRGSQQSASCLGELPFGSEGTRVHQKEESFRRLSLIRLGPP